MRYPERFLASAYIFGCSPGGRRPKVHNGICTRAKGKRLADNLIARPHPQLNQPQMYRR